VHDRRRRSSPTGPAEAPRRVLAWKVRSDHGGKPTTLAPGAEGHTTPEGARAESALDGDRRRRDDGAATPGTSRDPGEPIAMRSRRKQAL
jgi:hypothetical protein